MKTRNGFVSNSSSSSFVIYGIELPENIIYETREEKYTFKVYAGTEDN